VLPGNLNRSIIDLSANENILIADDDEEGQYVEKQTTVFEN